MNEKSTEPTKKESFRMLAKVFIFTTPFWAMVASGVYEKEVWQFIAPKQHLALVLFLFVLQIAILLIWVANYSKPASEATEQQAPLATEEADQDPLRGEGWRN